MKRTYPIVFLFALVIASCSHSHSNSSGGNTGASGSADSVIKISQFDHAGYCDFLIDKSGNYHTVFQENPAIGKPVFIYYATSTDKGATWSKPIAVSDDNTGNSSGYARILQDGSGNIYAIWKRYGNSATNDVMAPTLDGNGGYGQGTLFYKVLNGGTWSNEVMLNEVQQAQESWFATVAPTGVVSVVWAQLSPESMTNRVSSWYYCDYMRAATLNGTTPSAYKDLTTPVPQSDYKYPVKKAGAINLNGYVDQAGNYHLIWEDLDNPNDVQALKYFDGKTTRLVYNYPQYKAGNTFFNPGHLLVDEKGVDHVIFVPCAAALQSEQIWDVDMAANKASILTSIQQQGISIHGFQASQGPGGQMAVAIEAGPIMGTNEAFAMFYKNGTWTNVGLTNNAAKAKFFSKDFVGLGGYQTSVALLTSYSSTFTSMAYDLSGNKSLLMTIAGHTVSNSGYGIDNPFVTFIPVDR